MTETAVTLIVQQMTAAAVAREKAKLYAEFGRGGGEEGGLADDLAPEEFLELEELRCKWDFISHPG